MDLRAELAKLPAVQSIDLKLAALRAEGGSLRAGTPWDVARRRAAEAKRRLGALDGKITELETQERLADVERQSGEEERQRLERRLYGGEVRNTRDLEGLQKNIDGVKLRISEQESRVLEAMEALDTLGVQREAVREDLGRLEASLEQERAEGRQRLAELEADIPRLEAERQGLAAAVDPGLLAEYERVRSRLGGVGASVVAGESCSMCSVAVSAALVARLRRAQSLVTCESCGRILVLP